MGSIVDKPRRQISAALIQPGPVDRTLQRILLENTIDTTIAAGQADVVVADMRRADDVSTIPSTITRLRNAHPSRSPIMLVEPAQLADDTLRDLYSRETTVVSAKGERALLAEIYRKVLDRDFAAEAAIRIQAMAAAGLGQLPAHEAPSSPSALLVAPPGPLTLDLSHTLSSAIELYTVMSRPQALTALELKVADRVFVLPDRSRRPMAAMIKLIRRHSELSALPVVVFERQPTDRHRDYWSRTGADMVLPASEAAVGVVVSNQRRHERQAITGTSQFLRDASFTELGEPSRLCAPRYFDAALDLRCQTGGPFCLGAIRLQPHTDNQNQHIFTEPAIYVALGVQPTDLVTRAAPDLLLVSFPGTDLHHARRAMSMLSTLVQDLRFGPQDAPVTFSTQTNAVAFTPGADARGLIRSVIRGLSTVQPVHALFA